MSITPHPSEPSPPLPTAPAPGPRGRPLLAWLVIVGVIAFVLWRHSHLPPQARQEDELVQVELQGRALVGFHALSEKLDLSAQLKVLNRGPYGQRLRCAILAGELQGTEQALDELHRLDQLARDGRLSPSKEQQRLNKLLTELYWGKRLMEGSFSNFPGLAREKGAQLGLSESEEEELRDKLGWFGRLALTSPEDDPQDPERKAVLTPARRTVVGTISLVSVLGLGGLVGAVLLVALVALALAGFLRSGMSPAGGHGGIYAETFAFYMALYIGLSMLTHYLPGEWNGLGMSAALMLLSLVVLVWPVLRGLSWQQVCADIGWTRGRQPAMDVRRMGGLSWLARRVENQSRPRPLLEVVFGPLCYLSSLPGLLGGALLMLLLQVLRQRLGLGPDEFSPGDNPTHPIIHEVAGGTWGVRLQVFLVAAVCAPIVEETMFRGVLYRHLRDVFVPADGSRLGRLVGIVLAMLLVSFVFAVIHPQGFLAVPALMSLALGFNLFREWRGTLLPSMIAHGINNALVTAFLIFTVGDGLG